MQKRTLGKLEVSAIGLGCMGLSFGYGPAPDKQDAIALIRAAVRARRHLLRHRRGLRPVHQRGTGRRGAGAVPRPGRDRHQVRLQGRRLHGGPGQPAGAHPAGRRGVAQAAARPTASTCSTSTASIPNVPIEDVAGTVKDLIARRQGQALRPVGGRRRRRSAARTPCSRSTALQSEYSLWWREPEDGDPADAARNWASASCRSARSARAS